MKYRDLRERIDELLERLDNTIDALTELAPTFSDDQNERVLELVDRVAILLGRIKGMESD